MVAADPDEALNVAAVARLQRRPFRLGVSDAVEQVPVDRQLQTARRQVVGHLALVRLRPGLSRLTWPDPGRRLDAAATFKGEGPAINE